MNLVELQYLEVVMLVHLLKMTMDGFPRIAKTGDLSPPPGVEGISSIPYKVLDVKYDHIKP